MGLLGAGERKQDLLGEEAGTRSHSRLCFKAHAPPISWNYSLLANRPFLGAGSEGVIVLEQVWPFPLGYLNLSGALSCLL